MKIIVPFTLLLLISSHLMAKEESNLYLKGRVPASTNFHFSSSLSKTINRTNKFEINVPKEKYTLIKKQIKNYRYYEVIFH